jgi:hypothetical protein
LGGCDSRHGLTLRIQGVERNRKGGEFGGTVR